MTTGFPAKRRLILTGSVALAGLGIISFKPATVVAAANDRYPEDAFKQKDEKEAIKSLFLSAGALRSGLA
jgi:sulfur-oxidizing protein SoxY